MEKGRRIALLESVLALMDTANISVENAMDMLKISDTDRAELQKCLEERSS